ncbi:17816_t:CDS:2, partial [Funneliformis geosporum]
ECQNILNLQAQIFALQNNFPHIGMAGYASKKFSGRADEDIDEFIKDYRLYLMTSNITTANAGSKQKALELFWSCMTGETSHWVEDKLIGTILALNNAKIMATMINASDGTPSPALLVGATGVTVILAHNVHANEDWSIARGCLVDLATANNVPNGVLNNNNPIVFPDINISQVIYWFKRNYPTVARISDREKRIQFIRGFSPENKLEMKRLGLNRPLNNKLIEILEKIEMERNNLLLEDVDRIVNSRIQALQHLASNQSPAPSSGQENITKADLQAIAKSFQETMS